jgi:hypothetical protein
MHKLVLSLLLVMGSGNAAAAEENSVPSAVEDAARQFRILTYDQFRTDRAEFDTRRAAADELLANWNQAQQPREHRQMVAGWFIQAAAVTRHDPTAALPPVPQVPRLSNVSRLRDGGPDSATSGQRPAYLDPEAIQALDEVSGRIPRADGTKNSDGPSLPMSNVLNGLKRIVLGDE